METEQNDVKVGWRNTQMVGVVVLVLVLGAVGWYVFSREASVSDTNPLSEGGATTIVTVGGVTFELPPGGKVNIEEVPIENAGPAPNLERRVTFPLSFPTEAQSIWLQKVATVKSELAKNPSSYDAWLNIGLFWQMVEDYEGARLAWEYAVKLAPSQSVAFGNLGFLYGYYLRDNAKAEQNFKRALANAPQELYLYQQAFEFYRDVLKDPLKARALAEEGKRVTSNAAFFNQLLATLK